jgi:hypothetical protein
MNRPSVASYYGSLSDAIIYVFEQKAAVTLSFDQICHALQMPYPYVECEIADVMSLSSHERRRISQALYSSRRFTSNGRPPNILWTICEPGPHSLTAKGISSLIEQILTRNGPMTLRALLETTEFTERQTKVIARYLNEHPTEFTVGRDDTYWFADTPPPIYQAFESIPAALVFALSGRPEGATVEALSRALCFATLLNGHEISRRLVSAALWQRTRLFEQLSRGRYRLREELTAVELADKLLAGPPPPRPAGFPAIEVRRSPSPDPFFPPFQTSESWGIGADEGEAVFDPQQFFGVDFSFLSN